MRLVTDIYSVITKGSTAWQLLSSCYLKMVPAGYCCNSTKSFDEMFHLKTIFAAVWLVFWHCHHHPIQIVTVIPRWTFSMTFNKNTVSVPLPTGIYFFRVKQCKNENNMWSLLKNSNKDTIERLKFWCLYC